VLTDEVGLKKACYQYTIVVLAFICFKILDGLGKTCGVHLDVNSSSTEQQPPVQTSRTQSFLEKMSVAEFEDIVIYVSDIAFSLRAFLDVYPAAAPIFWETDRFPIHLAAAYEGLSTAFTAAFRRRVWTDQEQRNYLKKQIRRSQVCFLRVFRLIVYSSCLRPIVERRTDDASVSRLVENYLDLMQTLLSEKHFLAHLHTLFPLSADCDVLHGSNYLVDDVRLKYLRDACDDAVSKYVKRATKKDSAVVNESCIEDDVAETAGGEYRNLGGNAGGEFEGADVDEVVGACASEVSDAQIESMISSVRDLLPDLGPGFVRLCLEEYNYEVERVINAVLEDRLLPSLQDVDRSLTFVPDKTSRQPASLSQQPSLEQRRNIFDGDDFDVFSRDDVDKSRIHKGKRVVPDKIQPQVTPEIRDRIAAYAYRPVDVDDLHNGGDVEGLWEYDDEYDDTYDSNVIGADDVDSADELLARRAFVVPRVLAGMQGAGGNDDEDDDDDENQQLERPSINTGAAPPRDAFVEDPAKLRELREQKMAARQQHQQRQSGRRHGPPGASAEKPQKDHDVTGGPRGQGQSTDVLRNRAWKEKNKATRVHHNRKDLADRKRRV
jgi:activating signal cointegrator complex subunit 2